MMKKDAAENDLNTERDIIREKIQMQLALAVESTAENSETKIKYFL